MIEEEFLHHEIYTELLNWAASNGVHEEPMVESLLEDLRNEENLSIWATLDPFEFLPTPANRAGSDLSKWGKAAANLRNVSVFLPVALTWKAVSEATAAFGTFVENNQASTVNFLAFWQNGYDVLSSFWTIGHIASLDFLIILGVVLLSLVSNFLITKSTRLKYANLELIDQDRTRLALNLKIYLYSLREIDKGQMKEGIAASVSALQSATRALTKTAIEINSIMTDLKKAVPPINSFGSNLQKETKHLKEQVAILSESFSEINQSVISELKEAVDNASTGLSFANQELSASTDSIRRNAREAEREIKSVQGIIRKANKGK
jgi:cob(I)alamin adenosyltransferase